MLYTKLSNKILTFFALSSLKKGTRYFKFSITTGSLEGGTHSRTNCESIETIYACTIRTFNSMIGFNVLIFIAILNGARLRKLILRVTGF